MDPLPVEIMIVIEMWSKHLFQILEKHLYEHITGPWKRPEAQVSSVSWVSCQRYWDFQSAWPFHFPVPGTQTLVLSFISCFVDYLFPPWTIPTSFQVSNAVYIQMMSNFFSPLPGDLVSILLGCLRDHSNLESPPLNSGPSSWGFSTHKLFDEWQPYLFNLSP